MRNEDDLTAAELAEEMALIEDAEQTDCLEAVGFFDEAIASVMVPWRRTWFVPVAAPPSPPEETA